MHIGTMISSHLHVEGNLNEALVRAIEEANACAAICRICADACLGELMVADLVQSIRLDLDCADVCAATSIIGARRTGSNEAVIKRMLRYARRRARPAPPNATSMRRCMSIAGSAQKPAADAPTRASRRRGRSRRRTDIAGVLRLGCSLP